MMIEYVLGFAFTPDARLALIEKQKPDWQKCLWNGIGGKIEENESAIHAMVREFEEETTVFIPMSEWKYVGQMGDGKSWAVHIFTTVHQDVENVITAEKERVDLFALSDTFSMQKIENVPLLLEACFLQLSGKERVIPELRLIY